MTILGLTIDQLIFMLLAFMILASAVVVVTYRNLFHAALAMMASFLGVAGIYVLLEAGYLAAAQLLVYIGAISILVIFAIMMTRRLMQARETPFNSQWLPGLLAAVFSMGGISYIILNYWPLAPDTNVPLAHRTPVDEAVLEESVVLLGQSFVSAQAYVLPFEVASILLLAALIGAILLAWPQQPEEENR
ncbi:MAG: NADH-quinone oxidoreductase subunit J [Chloroflexota bacterium]